MKQQLINKVYEKSMFWSRYYEELDTDLSYAFDAVMQCLMFSQTVHKLDHKYSEKTKNKYLKETLNYINCIKQNYSNCDGLKDMNLLFNKYLELFD